MSSAHYFRVGLFVLLGIALLVAALVVLGGGSLDREPLYFETVFAESVQGLDVGAPVKFRGVKIGEVTSIGFVSQYYGFTNQADLDFAEERILVRMKFDPGRESRDELQQRKLFERRIERGLRMRLSAAGLTGTTFVQGDILDPESFPPTEIRWQPEVIYIPAATSTLEQFVSQAERLLGRVEDLNIEKMLSDLSRLIVALGNAVEGLDLAGLQVDVQEVLDGAEAAVDSVRREVVAVDLPGIGAGAREVLAEATTALRKVESSVDGGRYDLELALENLRVASENLRDLTDTLRDQPSLLLRSGAPEPVPSR